MSIWSRIVLAALLIAAVVWMQGGAENVLTALQHVNVKAVVIAVACHGASMSICGLAWWTTAGRPPVPSAPFFVTARWIRDGIGQLLPFVPLGGEVTGARLLALAGLGGTNAAAVTVVDLTAELMSQAVFSLIGAVIWAFQDGAWTYAGITIALVLPMALALYLAQKLGLIRLLENLANRVMPEAWQTDRESVPIHQAIHILYGDRRRFAASSTIHLIAWLAAIAESYFVLGLEGAAISPFQALALECVIFAVRSALFMVPGALGVQEGGYVLVGAALGLPAEIAMTLALVKRARELALGLPALAVWQWLSVRKNP